MVSLWGIFSALGIADTHRTLPLVQPERTHNLQATVQANLKFLQEFACTPESKRVITMALSKGRSDLTDTIEQLRAQCHLASEDAKPCLQSLLIGALEEVHQGDQSALFMNFLSLVRLKGAKEHQLLFKMVTHVTPKERTDVLKQALLICNETDEPIASALIIAMLSLLTANERPTCSSAIRLLVASLEVSDYKHTVNLISEMPEHQRVPFICHLALAVETTQKAYPSELLQRLSAIRIEERLELLLLAFDLHVAHDLLPILESLSELSQSERLAARRLRFEDSCTIELVKSAIAIPLASRDKLLALVHPLEKRDERLHLLETIKLLVLEIPELADRTAFTLALSVALATKEEEERACFAKSLLAQPMLSRLQALCDVALQGKAPNGLYEQVLQVCKAPDNPYVVAAFATTLSPFTEAQANTILFHASYLSNTNQDPLLKLAIIEALSLYSVPDVADVFKRIAFYPSVPLFEALLLIPEEERDAVLEFTKQASCIQNLANFHDVTAVIKYLQDQNVCEKEDFVALGAYLVRHITDSYLQTALIETALGFSQAIRSRLHTLKELPQDNERLALLEILSALLQDLHPHEQLEVFYAFCEIPPSHRQAVLHFALADLLSTSSSLAIATCLRAYCLTATQEWQDELRKTRQLVRNSRATHVPITYKAFIVALLCETPPHKQLEALLQSPIAFLFDVQKDLRKQAELFLTMLSVPEILKIIFTEDCRDLFKHARTCCLGIKSKPLQKAYLLEYSQIPPAQRALFSDFCQTVETLRSIRLLVASIEDQDSVTLVFEALHGIAPEEKEAMVEKLSKICTYQTTARERAAVISVVTRLPHALQELLWIDSERRWPIIRETIPIDGLYDFLNMLNSQYRAFVLYPYTTPVFQALALHPSSLISSIALLLCDSSCFSTLNSIPGYLRRPVCDQLLELGSDRVTLINYLAHLPQNQNPLFVDIEERWPFVAKHIPKKALVDFLESVKAHFGTFFMDEAKTSLFQALVLMSENDRTQAKAHFEKLLEEDHALIKFTFAYLKQEGLPAKSIRLGAIPIGPLFNVFSFQSPLPVALIFSDMVVIPQFLERNTLCLKKLHTRLRSPLKVIEDAGLRPIMPQEVPCQSKQLIFIHEISGTGEVYKNVIIVKNRGRGQYALYQKNGCAYWYLLHYGHQEIAITESDVLAHLYKIVQRVKTTPDRSQEAIFWKWLGIDPTSNPLLQLLCSVWNQASCEQVQALLSKINPSLLSCHVAQLLFSKAIKDNRVDLLALLCAHASFLDNISWALIKSCKAQQPECFHLLLQQNSECTESDFLVCLKAAIQTAFPERALVLARRHILHFVQALNANRFNLQAVIGQPTLWIGFLTLYNQEATAWSEDAIDHSKYMLEWVLSHKLFDFWDAYSLEMKHALQDLLKGHLQHAALLATEEVYVQLFQRRCKELLEKASTKLDLLNALVQPLRLNPNFIKVLEADVSRSIEYGLCGIKVS